MPFPASVGPATSAAATGKSVVIATCGYWAVIWGYLLGLLGLLAGLWASQHGRWRKRLIFDMFWPKPVQEMSEYQIYYK